MAGLIVKVLGFSLLLAIAIKSGGSSLPLLPTTATVLLAVWSPSAIVAVFLGWRWRKYRAASEK